tara:strand:- start:193 stop:594 length:402 start_codon:yes stop_codon:yes gene_type:complete
MEIERVRPSPNEDTKPYWDGLKEGRLLFQKCGDCGTIRHYPRQVCENCFSMEVDWIESSGNGKVHSWTVSQHAFHLSFKGDLPMTFVTVDMDEGVRVVAQLRGKDVAPTISMPVRIAFERQDDDLTVPVFYPG